MVSPGPLEIGYVFPGQGSQAVGMGEDFYHYSEGSRAVFDRADEALGFDLRKLIFDGPEEELKETQNAQPAIMVMSLACLNAWRERGVECVPRIMAGQSSGEITALVASDSLSLEDGIRLVRIRGKLMQEAGKLRRGGMVAIFGLDEETVEEICKEAKVEIANVNTDEQIVISGSRKGLDRALELAAEYHATRVMLLPVSGAFHSSLMKSATYGLRRAVQNIHFRRPIVPIVANCSAQQITAPEEIREELVGQLCNRVRWKDSVRSMVKEGTTCFVEFGPGKVVGPMIKRIEKKVQVFSVYDIPSLQEASERIDLLSAA